MDVPTLTDGIITLVCVKKHHTDFYGDWIPAYEFEICVGDDRIGSIRLRIGHFKAVYYSGHIGYKVDEGHRGKGYAGRACKLLAPVARHHGMTKLLITNNVGNAASYRVCEKLGTKFIRKTELPDWHDLYKEGQRFANIFEWDLMENGNQQSYAK